MKIFFTLILLTIAVYMPTAWAQCASGVDTGGQCIPPDALEPPGDTNQHAQPQQPQAVWATRWGAIARDQESGDAGTVEGQDSKSKANQIAIDICRRNGAKHCEIVLSFYNQCAAAALGKKILNASGGPTLESAQQTAISRCGGQTEECKIVYSACSLPVRVQ